MQTTNEIKAVLMALLRFQGKIQTIQRDKVNPHFKKRYVALETVIEQTRPILQDCGLVISQLPASFDGKSLMVETILAHAESGQFITSQFIIPLAKIDPQGAGSALTYAMRYAMMAMLGIAPSDDDDGNVGSQREPQSSFLGDVQKIWPGAEQREDGVIDPAGKGDRRSAGLTLEEQPFYRFVLSDLANCKTVHDVDRQGLAWKNKAIKDQMRAEWQDKIRALFVDKRVELRQAEEARHEQNLDEAGDLMAK